MKDSNVFVKSIKEGIESNEPINDILKIIIVVLFVALCFSTFALDTFITKNVFSIVDSYYHNWNITLYEMITFAYGDSVKLLCQLWCIVSCLLGAVSIWFNKPKKSMYSIISMIFFMLFTLTRNYEVYDSYIYWAIGPSDDCSFIQGNPNFLYWALWLMLFLLIGLFILALRYRSQRDVNSIDTIMPLNENSLSEIAKYKDLLNQGVITAEEFEAKKKQLLGI